VVAVVLLLGPGWPSLPELGQISSNISVLWKSICLGVEDAIALPA
jgi:hypothetical protein